MCIYTCIKKERFYTKRWKKKKDSPHLATGKWQEGQGGWEGWDKTAVGSEDLLGARSSRAAQLAPSCGRCFALSGHDGWGGWYKLTLNPGIWSISQSHSSRVRDIPFNLSLFEPLPEPPFRFAYMHLMNNRLWKRENNLEGDFDTSCASQTKDEFPAVFDTNLSKLLSLVLLLWPPRNLNSHRAHSKLKSN